MNAQFNAEYKKIQEQSTNSLQQMVDLKDAYAEVNQKMLQSSTSMNREVSAELRNSRIQETSLHIHIPLYGELVTQ